MSPAPDCNDSPAPAAPAPAAPDPSVMRVSYERDALDRADLAPDPAAQFRRWFAEAVASGTPEPNAMTLATVDADGGPSARVVLLKEVDADGAFVFYTNYESRKGVALAAHPRAALVFWWPPLERQVRIEGAVERVAAAVSDAYFGARPRASQLGAVASPQSRVVAGRADLEDAYAAAEAAAEDTGALARPDHWGGYRVRPSTAEFWQGRRSRLHDRLRYRRDDSGAWTVERLAP